MKKIGIYTIQSQNYGNRLQNYASQLVLEQMGYEIFSFKTTNIEESIEGVLGKHPRLKPFKLLIPILKQLKIKLHVFLKNDSRTNFAKFNRNIHYSNEYISQKTFSDVQCFEKYDAIIAGSDQIWNTEFDFITLNSFLPFEHPCKIALSASFGVDIINKNEKIVKCLNDFKALSVREDAGAKIIKELTGRVAEVIIDPTLMLTSDEWRNVSKKPKGLYEQKEYILTYFLSPKCNKAKEQLENIRENMLVYELLNVDDKVARNAGPAEFLYLFEHAKIILTDSFHACVFAFIFNKPFIVYDRNWNDSQMNSRLETLFQKFDLSRKYSESGLENDIWEHDYSEGYKKLENERKKAAEFLKKALAEC